MGPVELDAAWERLWAVVGYDPLLPEFNGLALDREEMLEMKATFLVELAASRRVGMLAERERVNLLIQKFIRFDAYQQHRHSWHDFQSLLAEVADGTKCERVHVSQLALEAAERRGMERAAGIVLSMPSIPGIGGPSSNERQAIAAAIRAAADAPGGGEK